MNILGCRIWGYGDALGSFVPVSGSGAIYGRVTASGTIEINLKSVLPAIKASIDVSSASVWLEQYPEIQVYTNSSGTFTFTNLPLESLRVVCKFQTQDGKTFKARSENIYLTSENPAKDVGSMDLEFANNKVRGILKDSAGNPIVGAELWLWGEKFFTGLDGSYISPPLPDSAELEQIFVKKAGLNAITTIVAPFTSEGEPFIVTVLSPANETNMAPMAFVLANKQQAAKIFPNTEVTLWGVFSNKFGILANDIISWELSGGKLASGTDALPESIKVNHPEIDFANALIIPYIWTAPSQTGQYTIKFSIKSQNGLEGTVQYPLNVTPIIVTPGVIAGRLLDETTDLPIEGALVGIAGTNKQTITDAQGYFKFTGLTAGTYDIIAARDNYKGKTFPGIVVP